MLHEKKIMYSYRRRAQRFVLEISSIFMLVILGLAWPAAVYAAPRVELTSEQVIDAGEQILLSAGIRVSNDGDTTQTYEIAFVSPTGWQCSAFPGTLRLEAGQAEIVFISIDQPPGAQAGDYPIIINCYPVGMPSIAASVEVTVRIPRLMMLLIRSTVPTPPDTLSGRDLVQTFNVTNTGNLRARISIAVEASVEWPITVSPADLRLDLEPDQWADVVVSTSIPEQLVGTENYHVVVTVRPEDEPGAEGLEWSAGTYTRIIPRQLTSGSNYATLDGTVQFQVSWHEEDDELTTRIAIDRLRSEIARGRTLTIGPFNTRLSGSGESSFQRDRALRVRYEDVDRGYIYAGDFSLNLRSSLLGRYLSGRGGDVAFRAGQSEFRAFYMRNRGSVPTDIGGVQFSQEFGSDGLMRLSALRTTERDSADTLEVEDESATNVGVLLGYVPSNQVEFIGEAAWSNMSGAGSSDTAWHISGKYVDQGFASNAEWLRAGEDFFGTWRNTELTRCYLSVSPMDDLSLRGHYYSRTAYNENVDPDLLDRNTRRWSVGATWNLGDAGRFGVTHLVERDWDPISDENDLEEVSMIYSYSRDWRNYHFYATWEDRDQEDALTGDTETERELRFDLQALLNRDTMLRLGYTNRRRSENGGANTHDRSTFRLGGEFALGDDTELILNLERDSGDTIGNRTSIRGRLLWELNNGSSVSFHLRSFIGESNNPTEVALSYAHPISIPLTWFPRKGSLEGRVFYAENPEQGLPNVLLSVGNVETVTDSDGYFIFPALDPGQHLLVVDNSTLGIGFIPDVELPITFDLDAGSTTQIDIPVRESVVIGGQVLIEVPGLIEADTTQQPLRDMVVELQHEGESAYRVTDAYGRFLYSDLLPGTYTIILRAERIPEWHTILNPVSYTLELESGESRRDLVFVVAPMERNINITTESPES